MGHGGQCDKAHALFMPDNWGKNASSHCCFVRILLILQACTVCVLYSWRTVSLSVVVVDNYASCSGRLVLDYLLMYWSLCFDYSIYTK
jgi:hypothetical protein